MMYIAGIITGLLIAITIFTIEIYLKKDSKDLKEKIRHFRKQKAIIIKRKSETEKELEKRDKENKDTPLNDIL